MADLIQIFFTCIVLLFAFAMGTYLEKRHYKKIKERETLLLDLPSVPSKFEVVVPDANQRARVSSSQLVMGSCVISNDYFKTFIAGIKTFFGGHLTTYESLVDRARRESVIRMKEEARLLGADVIVNTRIETSSIGGGSAGEKNVISSIEVLAYGTAVKFHH